jgi:hypothetical protein
MFWTFPLLPMMLWNRLLSLLLEVVEPGDVPDHEHGPHEFARVVHQGGAGQQHHLPGPVMVLAFHPQLAYGLPLLQGLPDHLGTVVATLGEAVFKGLSYDPLDGHAADGLDVPVRIDDPHVLIHRDDGVVHTLEYGLQVRAVFFLFPLDQVFLVHERLVAYGQGRCPEQVVLPHRFYEEVEGAAPQRIGGVVQGRLARDHDHGIFQEQRLHLLQQVHTRLPAEHDIYENEVQLSVEKDLPGTLEVRCGNNIIARLLQEMGEGEPDALLVVHHEDLPLRPVLLKVLHDVPLTGGQAGR